MISECLLDMCSEIVTYFGCLTTCTSKCNLIGNNKGVKQIEIQWKHKHKAASCKTAINCWNR